MVLKKLVLVAAYAGLIVSTPVYAGDTRSDPVIVERGNVRITAGQVRAMVAATEGDVHRKLTTDPAALTELLRNVLLQQAVLSQARAQKWEQRPDVAALLQRAHDQALAQSFLLAQAPLPANYPPETDIQALYTQSKPQLMQPRAYHLAQIFIPAASIHGDDGKTRLADLRTKIQQDHLSFETAAVGLAPARYADLGFLPENNLIPAVKSAVAGLLEGALTDPLCTSGGCSLLKLVATRPAGPAPLADVHDKLATALRQQKLAQQEQAYANTLLAKTPIRLNEVELAHLINAPTTK